MPEPADLVDKVTDAGRIGMALLHDGSENPVTPPEVQCVFLLSRILSLLEEARERARELENLWP